MSTCITCRYWGKDPDALPGNAEFAGYGKSHPGEARGLKPCEHPKVGAGSYADEARNGADSANSYDTIATGPDFGCIHWSTE